MLNFLIFLMVLALFIHTFFNFASDVWAVVVAKLERYPTDKAIAAAETFVGGIATSIVKFFKKL